MTVEPQQLSARVLAAALRSKEISAREVLDAHFAQIDAWNPSINAVVTQVREEACAAALRADEMTACHAPENLPPLHGVPMTHKDTHNTKGIRTTSGSPVFSDFLPDFDDLIVARFRAAGVISTGKNNVPEFAAGSHTFNEVFGTTSNPYDLSRTVGGSSGGAAAALTTRIQALADGSDMGGLLRNPAAFCNVVGFRPSQGLIPVAPSRNAWAWLARTGPMGRAVDDIALAMSVLTGPDPRVPFHCPVDPADFVALDGAAGSGSRPLSGVKIGLTVDFGLGVPVEQEVADTILVQAQVFEELGAVVELACPDLTDADEVFDTTRAFDMATNLREIVVAHPEQVKPEVVWNVRKGLDLSADELMKAALARTRLHQAVHRFFTDYDVMLAPTTQVLPFPSTDRWPRVVASVPMVSYVEWMRSVCLISAMGCPAVSVPAGFSRGGLPVGLQMVAQHGRDAHLLRVAMAYEEATGHANRAPELPGPATGQRQLLAPGG
ncbi:MAG: amidase [Ornithinimicrobium sp.]|uniref:amidase n=1 Tax=Ornithinimicrobium sp. TaxID=1977084 RepID=UPI003D9B83FF